MWNANAPRALAALLGLVLLVPACEDESTSSSAPPPTDGTPSLPDVPAVPTTNMDAAASQPPPPDMALEKDWPLEPDFPDLYIEPPDMPPPPGDAGLHLDFGAEGPPCDPRRRAAACEAGFYCVQDPGRPIFVGHCVAGQQCNPLEPGAVCVDPARPYCHVQGGATFCTPEGHARVGEDCVDRDTIPQPCAPGLACLFSTCERVCNPSADPTGCAANWRCENYEGSVGVPFGICRAPACDWFTARGCEAGEKCSYTRRAPDNTIVGSCTPLEGPGNGPDSPCGNNPGGGDNCGVGLVCIGQADGDRFCKILCDTGGYEAPCPGSMACEERLATHSGLVHGLGICVTLR